MSSAKKPESKTKERRRRTVSQTDEQSNVVSCNSAKTHCLLPNKSVLDQSVPASLALTQDKLVDGILDYKTSAEMDYDVIEVKQSTKITATEVSEVSVTKTPDNRRVSRVKMLL